MVTVKHYRIERPNDRPLEFDGIKLAAVSSQRAGSERWCELDLFRTRAGAFVFVQVGKSDVPGESDRRYVRTAKTESELRRYAGTGRLASKLYYEAGLEESEVLP